MKKLTLTSGTIKGSLYIALFALPLIAPSWHGKILVILGLIWIISIREIGLRNALIGDLYEYKKLIIFNALLFSLQCAGIFFSVNRKSGLSSIESMIPLLILPVVIFSSDSVLNPRAIRYVVISFIAGVITLNLASLAFISYDLWDYKNLESNIILANNSIVQIHPAFISLYISFSIFFLINQYFPLQTNNRSKLGWILFGLVILITYLLWINSRTGILSFCIAFIFFSFYRFRSNARIVSLSVLVLFFLIIYLVPFSRERFYTTPRVALSGEVSLSKEDPNLYTLVSRRQILDCSIELLKGPEFFYGYGTGDFRDVLRDCFKEKNYTSLYNEGLDSHNEYFAQMHRHGIIGLALFVALMIIPFRYALRYKSPLLAVFIILFAVTALFENVFSAQKGVTFFALFCPLLMLYARKNFESNGSTKQPV